MDDELFRKVYSSDLFTPKDIEWIRNAYVKKEIPQGAALLSIGKVPNITWATLDLSRSSRIPKGIW